MRRSKVVHSSLQLQVARSGSPTPRPACLGTRHPAHHYFTVIQYAIPLDLISPCSAEWILSSKCDASLKNLGYKATDGWIYSLERRRLFVLPPHLTLPLSRAVASSKGSFLCACAPNFLKRRSGIDGERSAGEFVFICAKPRSINTFSFCDAARVEMWPKKPCVTITMSAMSSPLHLIDFARSNPSRRAAALHSSSKLIRFPFPKS